MVLRHENTHRQAKPSFGSILNNSNWRRNMFGDLSEGVRAKSDSTDLLVQVLPRNRFNPTLNKMLTARSMLLRTDCMKPTQDGLSPELTGRPRLVRRSYLMQFGKRNGGASALDMPRSVKTSNCFGGTQNSVMRNGQHAQSVGYLSTHHHI